MEYRSHVGSSYRIISEGDNVLQFMTTASDSNVKTNETSTGRIIGPAPLELSSKRENSHARKDFGDPCVHRLNSRLFEKLPSRTVKNESQ